MSTAKINDGGPAFPANDAQHAHAIACAAEGAFTGTPEERERAYIKARGEAMRGMPLRDYLAAHADIPWAVAAEVIYLQNGKNGSIPQIMEKLAQLRYGQADAMLKARAA